MYIWSKFNDTSFKYLSRKDGWSSKEGYILLHLLLCLFKQKLFEKIRVP